MKNITALGLLSGFGGLLTGAAVSYGDLEKNIINYFQSKGINPLNIIDGLDELPDIATSISSGAAVGLTLFAGGAAVLGIGSLANRISKKETSKKENSLYDIINQEVISFKNKVKKRVPISTHTPKQEAHAIKYQRRLENKEFLKTLAENLHYNLTHSIKQQEFQSGIHPNLLTSEVRSLLQPAFYVDLPDYIKKVEIPENLEIDWNEFEKIASTIGNFAESLKNCYIFYSNFCREQKEEFNTYNILPYQSSKFDEQEIFLLLEGKELEDIFSPNLIQMLIKKEKSVFLNLLKDFSKDTASKIKVPFNPTIEEVYDLFDGYVEELTEPLNNLLTRSKSMFKYYELAINEPYQRIKWIIEKAEKDEIKKESVSFYTSTLSDFKSEIYTKQNKNKFHKQMISEKEVERTIKDLNKMAGTQIIDQTKTYKKDQP
ncbi:hypothetical protein GF361_02555 [Candidatus Woesearchaeota archaeon]|nr:hypothetical protein [Candidatus Woesearchaeota archaeon]